MRITFVLPVPIRIPMGGAKVVYTHAAGLAARSHTVSVACPARPGGGAKGWAMSVAMRVRDRLHRVESEQYYGGQRVGTLVVPTIADMHMPDADAVIATGVQTASWVRDLHPSKGAKYYFLQHVETFIDPAAVETWRYPLAKFAIANWIRERVEAEGESVAAIVPNAIDPAEFFVSRPIKDRPPSVIALYHRHPVKGPEALISALERLKSEVPVVSADIFCARRPSHRIPPWVKVHVRPRSEELLGLYNRSSVVWSTSRSEGWGLVTMEGAACGCAVVATATEGIREYLTDGASARLVPIDDVTALVEATRALFENQAERIRLAEGGMAAVGSYSWAASTSILEDLLLSRNSQ